MAVARIDEVGTTCVLCVFLYIPYCKSYKLAGVWYKHTDTGGSTES